MTTVLPPRVQEACPADVKSWVDEGIAALIDVREPDEVAAERIADSRSMPLSRFDTSSLPAGRLVFHCASGPRSLEAAARVAGRDEVFTLAGGIRGWTSAGLPTVRDKRVPISIMRQVQITVGTVVLACSVLAVVVSSWFALLAAFMGAGLLFAGATGTCGMAAALARMPWNGALRAANTMKR
jgi:rhodanese-related sulfurtransferase